MLPQQPIFLKTFLIKIIMHQSVKLTDAIWLFTAGNLFPSHSCIGWPKSSPHWDSNPNLRDRRLTNWATATILSYQQLGRPCDCASSFCYRANHGCYRNRHVDTCHTPSQGGVFVNSGVYPSPGCWWDQMYYQYQWMANLNIVNIHGVKTTSLTYTILDEDPFYGPFLVQDPHMPPPPPPHVRHLGTAINYTYLLEEHTMLGCIELSLRSINVIEHLH